MKQGILFLFILISGIFIGYAISISETNIVITILLSIILTVILYPLDINRIILGTFIFLQLASSARQIPFFIIFKTLRWIPISILALRSLSLIFLKRQIYKNLSSVHYIFSLFFLYVLFTLYFSINPMVSLYRCIAYFLVFFGIFFVIWVFIDSTKKIYQIFSLFKKTSFIILIISFGLIYWEKELVFINERFRGILGNPNDLGIICGIMIPYIFYEKATNRTTLFRFIIYFLTFSIALFLSGSRGGLAAAFIGASILFIQLGIKRVFLYTYILALIAYLIFISSYWNIIDLPTFRKNKPIYGALTMDERMEAWEVGWNLFKKRPILGYGFGTGDLVFSKSNIKFKYHQGAYVHNSYLQFLLDTGIIGTSLIITCLGVITYKGLKIRNYLYNEEAKFLGFVFLAIFLAGCAHIFIESWLVSPGSTLTFLFWLDGSLILKINMLLEQKDYHL